MKFFALPGVAAKILCATFALLATNASAQSDEHPKRLSIAAGVGTLGVGWELKYPLLKNLYGRLVWNQYDFETDDDISDSDYHIEFELGTYGLIGDWHPFGGDFRLSAGLLSNDNKLGVRTDGDTFTFNDNEYDGNAQAEVDFDSSARFVGLGFSSHKKSGLSFDFEVGVLLQGDVSLSGSGSATHMDSNTICNFSVNDDGDATVTATGGTLCADGQDDAAFEADIEAEHADLVDDLDVLENYPVIAFSLQYRF